MVTNTGLNIPVGRGDFMPAEGTPEWRAWISDRVTAGVAWLDSHDKKGHWWRDLDLSRLDMQDCTECVLGQVVSYAVERPLGERLTMGYRDVVDFVYPANGKNATLAVHEALDMDTMMTVTEAQQRGFHISHQGDEKEWQALTDAWVVAVRVRRAIEGVPS